MPDRRDPSTLDSGPGDSSWIRLLLGAARSHLKAGEFESAIECAGRVHEIAASADEDARVDALRLSAEAHAGMGDRKKAREVLGECAAAELDRGEHLAAAAIECEIGRLSRHDGELAVAKQHLQRSLRLTASLEPGPARADALEQLGPVERLLGHTELALKAMTEALRIREALGDDARVAIDHERIGNIHAGVGQFDVAEDQYQRALVIYRARHDRKGMALALNNLGTVQLHCGNYGAALSSFGESRDLAVAVGIRKIQASATGNMGLAHAYLGNLADAEPALLESYEASAELGDQPRQATFANNLSMVFFNSARFGESIRWAQTSLQHMTALEETESTAKPWFHIARACLELREAERAEAAAKELRTLATQTESPEIRCESLLVDAAVAVSRNETEAALRLAETAADQAKSGGYVRQRAEALRLVGEACFAAGDFARAQEVWTESEGLLLGLGDVYHLAVVRLHLGRLFRRIGALEAAGLHLREARDEFTRLGHRPWLSRVLTALAEVDYEGEGEESGSLFEQALTAAESTGREDLVEEVVEAKQRLKSGQASLAPAAGLHPEFVPLVESLRHEGPSRFWFAQVCKGLQVRAGLLVLGREGEVRWGDSADLEAALAEVRKGRLVRRQRGDRWTLGQPIPGSKEASGALLLEKDTAFSAEEEQTIHLLAVALSLVSAPPEGIVLDTKSVEPYEGMIGESSEMRAVFETISRIAESEASVLLLGESGTGKELVAHAIHNRSLRAAGPFVAISCPSIPRELIEAELFGHEKGAFTGAAAQKLGQIERADGGTLFLDEIGDMDLGTQTKLLRFLQEREFLRVGGRESIRVNIRVLAATSRDLDEEIAAGRFRLDLYYRIGVIPLKMPPLRDRAQDVPPLIRHFARSLSGGKPFVIDRDAFEGLASYPWPGNVRELRNVVEYLLAMRGEGRIAFRDLPARIRDALESQEATEFAGLRHGETLEARLMTVEGSLLRSTLEECGWNQVQAAKKLGLKESTLRYKMKRFGIRRPARGRRGKGEAKKRPEGRSEGSTSWLH